MSYFNPHIYNKENLKEADRERLEYIKEQAEAAIDNAKDDFCETTGSKTVDNIRNEFIDSFCERLMNKVGLRLQEYTVWIIENYKDDGVQYIEHPTLFYGDVDDYPHFENTKGAQHNAD